MKTMEELRKYLLENFVDDEGDLMIIGLDLSEFEGNVYRGSWIVKNNLRQYCNMVGGNLKQYGNKVKGNLDQFGNEVEGDLVQTANKVKGNLDQSENIVKGNLDQSKNIVEGNLDQFRNEVKGKTYTDFKKHTKVMKYENESETEKWISGLIVRPESK